MPLFNPDKIAKLVSEMRKAVGHLKTLRELGKEKFAGDPDKVGSAKYHFIVAIEAAIDICNHIISQNGYRAPEDYADTFQVLREQGAFDSVFTRELREMAKFRNRLTHLYWEVDDVQVYDILSERLGDFKKFLDGLSAFLELEKL
ncbi:MAG: DUF86 domain-containing protein [Candidatus Sulfobium sp.]|jgi:uncharacterized protein YutE (UPF0331/DUF86 family)